MNGPYGHSIKQIQQDLLSWFEISGRSFPWRNTNDPYKILVAEKLLQQTSVRPDPIKAYEDLIGRYPTNKHLAAANVEVLHKFIQSLGLHYRATELVKLAQVIQERHSGVIPSDLEHLMQLPGVGDYISRALLCFAFCIDVPVVDTNVARILYRLFGIQGKFPQNPSRNKILLNLAASMIPNGMSRNFNLALLDLGALVCQSKEPICGDCPLLSTCMYGKKNGEDRNARA